MVEEAVDPNLSLANPTKKKFDTSTVLQHHVQIGNEMCIKDIPLLSIKEYRKNLTTSGNSKKNIRHTSNSQQEVSNVDVSMQRRYSDDQISNIAVFNQIQIHQTTALEPGAAQVSQEQQTLRKEYRAALRRIRKSCKLSLH